MTGHHLQTSPLIRSPSQCLLVGLFLMLSGCQCVGSPHPPTSQGPWQSVSGGGNHTCALLTDGTVECWGSDIYGQSSPPGGAFTQVVAGWGHTCGLREDGTVACWGYDTCGQLKPPLNTFVQLSAGESHTCGLLETGKVLCWGAGTDGPEAQDLPSCSHHYGQSTPPPGEFRSLSAGGLHTCGVRKDGTASCWGLNLDGQSTAPPGTFRDVAAGYGFSCGSTAEGVSCWGRRAPSIAEHGGVTTLTGGYHHLCGLEADGDARCWLGQGVRGRWEDRGQADVPAERFVQLSAGAGHTCGVTNDGHVRCWGNDSQGRTSPPER